jgi:hypothetical protein
LVLTTKLQNVIFCVSLCFLASLCFKHLKQWLPYIPTTLTSKEVCILPKVKD